MSAAMRMMPFLGLVVLAYIAIALGGGMFAEDFSMERLLKDVEIFAVTLPSGDLWAFELGEAFVFVGLIFMGIEMVNSAQTDRAAMFNHTVTLLVFVGALVLFIVAPGFSTTTFFLLTTMLCVDALGGMLVGIVAARRDWQGAGPMLAN
jgi:hypothetical protein